mmetsp:Transcript_134251/g.428994  ORF Transcript_134251/g.428994 Transcript_134251/m.428994 type:complete len:251 (+) Transcript_134251:1789-2541(+)
MHLAAIRMLCRGVQTHAAAALCVQVRCPRQALLLRGPDEVLRQAVGEGRQLLHGVRARLTVVRLPQSPLRALQALCAVEVRPELLPRPTFTPSIQGLWMIPQVQRQTNEGTATKHTSGTRASQVRGELWYRAIAWLTDACRQTTARGDVLVDDVLVRDDHRAAVGLRWRTGNVQHQNRVLAGGRQSIGQDGACQAPTDDHEVVLLGSRAGVSRRGASEQKACQASGDAPDDAPRREHGPTRSESSVQPGR